MRVEAVFVSSINIIIHHAGTVAEYRCPVLVLKDDGIHVSGFVILDELILKILSQSLMRLGIWGS